MGRGGSVHFLILLLAEPVEFSAEPDTSTNVLSFQNEAKAKTVLVRLAIPQKPIGSAPVYHAQCTLLIYQTLIFDFLKVCFETNEGWGSQVNFTMTTFWQELKIYMKYY